MNQSVAAMASTRRDNAISAPLGAAVHFGRGALGRRGGVVRGVDLVRADADGKVLPRRQHECGAQRREQQR